MEMGEPGGSVSGTQEDAATLVAREFGTTIHQLLRLRLVAGSILLGLATWVALSEPGSWRLWVAAGAGVALLGVTAVDARRFPTTYSLGKHLYALGMVWLIHTIIILLTGGIDSPFVLLYLPVAVLAGVGIGRLRLFLAILALPTALVWAFATLAALGFGPALTPDFFGPAMSATRESGYFWVFAVMLTVTMLVGGTLGLMHRRVLDRALAAAVSARAEALDTMHERNRELMALSGALAHELKNPLASIQGLAGLLARKLPEGTREAEQVGVLLSEVRRMGGILDEFLNFSRPVQGLAVREVAVGPLVEELGLLHEALARARGVRLVIESAAGETLACDPRKVKQVLVNLLQNALDATPAGGTVTLRARDCEGGGTRFEVLDTGTGLAEEVRGRLFRPGTTTKPLGSGLGLTIARAIAEQHGGALTLADREEGGCRAVLALPRVPATAEEGA